MRAVLTYLAAGASVVVIFPVLCFGTVGAIAGVVKHSSGTVVSAVTTVQLLEAL